MRRSNLSGISLRFEEGGGFVLSNWASDSREGILFNLYNANFYGRFDAISKVEGCMIYEARISSIDEAGGMIYDIYYPRSDDVERFADHLPWKPGTTLRIVPPLEAGGICLIGIPDDRGEYSYTELSPRE